MRRTAVAILGIALLAATDASAAPVADFYASVDQVGSGGGRPPTIQLASIDQLQLNNLPSHPPAPDASPTHEAPGDQSALSQTDVSDASAVTQSGVGDNAAIVQSGPGEIALVTQSGFGDVSLITQSGANDQATVIQTRDGARSAITQTGIGNTAFVRQ
jgi:hypothetical protein